MFFIIAEWFLVLGIVGEGCGKFLSVCLCFPALWSVVECFLVSLSVS